MTEISQLSTELLFHIFEYCDPPTLERVGRVCADWRALLTDPSTPSSVARKCTVINDLSVSEFRVNPRAIHWKRITTKGVPLNLFLITPGMLTDTAVLAGRCRGRDGIVVLDSETFQEVAFLPDQGQRRRPIGWLRDREGKDAFVVANDNGCQNPQLGYQYFDLALWSPTQGSLEELPIVPDNYCLESTVPLLWQGEPSLLYLRRRNVPHPMWPVLPTGFSVRLLKGGPSTLLTRLYSDQLELSPQKDLVVVSTRVRGEDKRRHHHRFRCWSAETGQRLLDFFSIAYVDEFAVVGQGEHACVVTKESIDDGHRQSPHYLRVYPLQPGQKVQTLFSRRRGNGWRPFTVSHAGRTSYVHAYIPSFDKNHFRVRSWQFIEGHAKAIPTQGRFIVEPADESPDDNEFIDYYSGQSLPFQYTLNHMLLPVRDGAVVLKTSFDPDDDSLVGEISENSLFDDSQHDSDDERSMQLASDPLSDDSQATPHISIPLQDTWLVTSALVAAIALTVLAWRMHRAHA